MTESKRELLETFSPFKLYIRLICMQKDAEKPEYIGEYVSKINEFFLKFLLRADEEYKKVYETYSDSEKELISALIGTKEIRAFLSMPEFAEELDHVFGSGAGDFLLESFMEYGERVSGEESFREYLELFEENIKK